MSQQKNIIEKLRKYSKKFPGILDALNILISRISTGMPGVIVPGVRIYDFIENKYYSIDISTADNLRDLSRNIFHKKAYYYFIESILEKKLSDKKLISFVSFLVKKPLFSKNDLLLIVTDQLLLDKILLNLVSFGIVIKDTENNFKVIDLEILEDSKYLCTELPLLYSTVDAKKYSSLENLEYCLSLVKNKKLNRTKVNHYCYHSILVSCFPIYFYTENHILFDPEILNQ